MTPDAISARLRLDRALDALSVTFRGMTARRDETQCTCHWGDEEELALLKTPDVELDPDLLRRTWDAPDWHDHGAVLRRILPQFARELVAGRVEPMFGFYMVGTSFTRGEWTQWPGQQSDAVWEFLHAWWSRTLLDPDPAVPAHELLALCAEAVGTFTPWLDVWETHHHPVADRHLALTVEAWEYELLGDALPFSTWHDDEDALRTELSTWLARYAPARLRACGASEELQHRARLIGLSGPARWEDPHYPIRAY
ncbi:hypothetical protein Stsp02_30250 [Streptomyces sp. NBRC 14336]|uniref:hypothetical protein n=1 Tax=Streptomyces sp. NBRC 14336 TaxID=3030992 RepID=UPI0024A4E4AB|nr:hypothetical protein [Streptomyces sp. NBRC 14336]GLW47363.1 hypothetical protein Stsp02_30250 [Streptomyces sp. NBRC 14336]